MFRRERCDRCHTLFDAPTASGRASYPGRFDPGSRLGPDLAVEGHRRSDDWHLAHLYAPAAVVRGSSMPASRHLFTSEGGGPPAPSRDARDLVAFLQALGRGRRDIWAERRLEETPAPDPPPADEALRRRGRALYRRHCAGCHGEEGNGAGDAAALLGTPPRDLTTGRYHYKSTAFAAPPRDDDIFRIITLGGGIGSAMPSFAELGADDRWALVLRVKDFAPSLRGTGLRADAGGAAGRGAAAERDGSEDALIARGRALWIDLGCLSCHGPPAMGEESGDPRAADAPRGAARRRPGLLRHACELRGGASRLALERAFVLGVGLEMPSYGAALPDPEDRGALTRYLRSRVLRGGDPDREAEIATGR